MEEKNEEEKITEEESIPIGTATIYFPPELQLSPKEIREILERIYALYDRTTTSTATARGLVADLAEKLSDKNEIKGQELFDLQSKIETLDQVVELQSQVVGELKQTTEKLSPLLVLTELDTEEIVNKAPFILLDQRIKNIETIAKHSEDAAKEAKEIAKDARSIAQNIRMIYILVIVLYAILAGLGVYFTFFGG